MQHEAERAVKIERYCMWSLTKQKVRERRLRRKLEGRENLHGAGWKREAEL